ncbi:hypothetical protein BOX15_Mlig013060g1 [Macrostomum lignano]|uniref:GST C-terminal domain-containing protein n=2 Tax=Macrostomum lignano TaxID=282301 RepID=A0A1I8GET5_9PLAT|nr:hypothetical protein BOX15_Mlig013060g1 [Macrostomum lignano]
MSDMNGFEGDVEDGKPVVELFIKASHICKEDKGPCPISQQWFMVFYILAEKKYLNLFVTTVNPDMPPEAYQALEVGRHLPVARVIKGADPRGSDLSNTVFDTNDEIEQLMDIWKCPCLALPKESADEGEAEKAFYDLYKNLNLMLKTENSTPLLHVLRRIDSFLGSRGCRFLLSDELTYADCQLMPKLHHVKMAGKFYRDFDVPADLNNLQAYYSAMYDCEAFRCSCPADRDLYQLYYDKLPKNLVAQRPQPSLMDDSRVLLGESGSGGIGSAGNGAGH